MKQVIKKTIKEAKNINDEPLIYTLLVDGNNLMKISSVDKRMNGKGEEYGIVFQFLWQLHKLLQVKDYNFVYVMLDGEKSGQLRYNFYQDYKANRDKNYELSGSKSEYDKQIDAYVKKVLDYSRNKKKEQEPTKGETEEESFERQKLILKQILEELFVRVCEYDEVEGDDLIAHYVKNKKSNERVVIVSGDRDLTQLINDEVCVYIPSLKSIIQLKIIYKN
jgi:5'-3' exonuclease